MKVTNNLRLPQAFVNAVSVERHNKAGCYSATTLNKGEKEVLLTERHYDELTVDAADSVWAVWGTAVHAILEKSSDDNFHEEYFEVKVSNSTVTGTVDSYDMEHCLICDWKTASVYKIQKDDYSDWYKQGMTYAWLLKKSGLDVNRVRFIALLKDHSKTKAEQDSSYPQAPVYVYEFEVTPEELEQTGKRINEKVKSLEMAQLTSDDDIAPCRAGERWADGEKWAVMKNGRKTAVRLFDNEAAADAMAGSMGNSYFVEHRKAIDRKCGKYCICNQFCNYYKAQQQNKGGNDD